MNDRPAAAVHVVATALNRAAEHAAAGQHAEAIGAMGEALAAAPDRKDVLRRVGGGLLGVGADEAACLCFLRLLELAPDDPQAAARIAALRPAAPAGWMPTATTGEMIAEAMRRAVVQVGRGEPAGGDDGAPIDLVVTWVDGAKPDFQARLARRLASEEQRRGAAPDPSAHGPQRFRDGGTLRHLLRSVEACLPWLGRVFLVTDGQVPSWLDTRHPRLRLVRHAEIFPDPAMLPCFNSSAIETCLHRIPGLGERFLFLNDDMLFLRELPRSALLAADGRPALVFGARWVARDNSKAGLWEQKQARITSRLEARIGPRPFWRAVSHGPLIFERRMLAEIEASWDELFDQTRRNPFRTAEDTALHLLYLHHAEADRRAAQQPLGWRQATHRDIRVIQVGHRRSDWRGAMMRAFDERAGCICLNDNCPDTPTEDHESATECAADLTAFLAAAWPTPSGFERRCAATSPPSSRSAR